MVPVTVDGQRVRLEMRIYQPAMAGPAPTLVFNHGSTGRGSDPRIFTRGARYPGESLWLYADEDVFYPLSHSRENFAAFEAAGGKGAFHEFPPGSAGHYLRRRPDRWSAIVEAYLKRQGLPSEKP
jgi:hypothetical protein